MPPPIRVGRWERPHSAWLARFRPRARPAIAPLSRNVLARIYPLATRSRREPPLTYRTPRPERPGLDLVGGNARFPRARSRARLVLPRALRDLPRAHGSPGAARAAARTPLRPGRRGDRARAVLERAPGSRAGPRRRRCLAG